MSVRVGTFWVLLSAWVFSPAVVQAQVTLEDLKDSLDEISTKIDSLIVQKDIAVVRTEFDQLKQRVDALHSDVATLTEVVHDGRTALGDIVKKVRGADGREMFALNIKDQMRRAPTFRAEMADAVHDSMRRQGTLRVENQMSTDQYLRVNGGSLERIPARGSRTFDVRVGTFTTELVGYERPKHWTITPPNYELTIGIRPNPASNYWYWDPLEGWVQVLTR